jgi:hypothetical protein
MLSATTILLTFWLAVVLFCDLDGFKARRRRMRQEEEAERGSEETATRP